MVLGGSSPTLLTPLFLVYLYTDPGYGTLIWQLLLAGFFGGMFYIRRLKDFLARRKESDHGEQVRRG